MVISSYPAEVLPGLFGPRRLCESVDGEGDGVVDEHGGLDHGKEDVHQRHLADEFETKLKMGQKTGSERANKCG